MGPFGVPIFKKIQLGRYLKGARIDPGELDVDSTAISGISCEMNFFPISTKRILMFKAFPNYLCIYCFG